MSSSPINADLAQRGKFASSVVSNTTITAYNLVPAIHDELKKNVVFVDPDDATVDYWWPALIGIFAFGNELTISTIPV